MMGEERGTGDSSRQKVRGASISQGVRKNRSARRDRMSRRMAAESIHYRAECMSNTETIVRPGRGVVDVTLPKRDARIGWLRHTRG